MPKFAANVSMLFTEAPFLERFDRAAAAGFKAVEFQFPYSEDVPGIAERLKRHNLTQVLFNYPAGDFAAGERGQASNPAKVAEFREGVKRGLDIAQQINCGMVNCMVGLRLKDVSAERQRAQLVENLRYCATEAAKVGVKQLFEPLNHFDAPGISISSTAEALKLIEEVGHPNLSIQYDVYHMQRMEGNLADNIQKHIAHIGHVQIADSPARNEPGTGEINFPFVFQALDAAGYAGWVALEYKPSTATEATLGWLRSWGYWQ